MFEAPSQILMLMAFPVTGAIIIGTYLFFSIRGRSKKGKMKHGILSSHQNNLFQNEQPASQLPPSTNSSAEIGVGHKHPSAFPAADDDDDNLNMDILNNLGGRSKDSHGSKPLEPDTVDVNARLENSSSPSPPIQPQEPVELLRLLRDPQSGQLIVQIGEQRYRKLTEVADKKIGQFILKLAAHLLAFTNGMIVTEAGLKSVYNPKVGQVPEPVVDHSPPANTTTSRLEPATPAQTQPVIPPQATTSAAPPLTPPIPSPLSPQPEPAPSRGLFGLPKSSPALPSMLPTINLAKEINDIVQNRLIYSPLGQTTKIDIISAPDGGIRINVNGSFYSTPDEVPDPEVKNLIKESIKQWERS